MTEKELFLMCKKDVNLLDEKVFTTKYYSLTISETCGCRH